MFDNESSETAGGGVDYAFMEPLAPGAVDPMRLAALVEGLDAGDWLLDPEEFARVGPDPDVDPAVLPAAFDDVHGDDPKLGERAVVVQGPVEPSVLVPARVPGLEDMPPGPALAGVLEGVDLSGLGAYELVEAVAGWQRIASWAAARQAEAVAELAGRVEMRPMANGREIPSMTPQRVTGLEVAARLRLTPGSGEALVARSVCLVRMLPATRAALAEGRIDTRRAEVVADELGRHKAAVARRVEVEVLDCAHQLTAPRLRQALKRALHRVVPVTMEQRRDDAAAARHVTNTPAADGMAWLEAYLPAEDAAALEAAIEAAAAAMKRTAPGDRRTLAQRRADALAQMGWLALGTGRLGGCTCGQGQPLDRRHRRPVTVQVTVAATTLLGLDDQPGQLAGYGPVPASVARRLAAEGTWRRLLTDPVSGTVLDYGRTRYPPPPDLVDHVVARDRTCRWPGCDRPAATAEIDHTTPYPDGATAADDLGPFCKSHHIGKHHSRWRVRQPEPGRFEWISPTGHSYTVEPEPVGPVEPDPPF
ncbi:MAG TPA: DUF222 domain-containing protein [Jiangellaceae bacterium]|nr:DUF222 domain-containing protein [Jiangellaceae bacterium]